MGVLLCVVVRVYCRIIYRVLLRLSMLFGWGSAGRGCTRGVVLLYLRYSTSEERHMHMARTPHTYNPTARPACSVYSSLT
jgi:hypothetical protein